ncbi:MAG TPA: NUMOD3 domain-containing DNA-binding protein [Candidatus Diapherotrites archaeon]|nr:NUMOD3 domain-containing DNA-binding protein [Candidatus Diapherotrites archaeon]
MTEGGPTLIGYKHTKETKKKIGDSRRGKSMKDIYIQNYGEELGMKKYEGYLEKLNKSNGKGRSRLELFIERNGEIEGRKKYEIFIQSIKDARKRSPSGFKGKKMSKKQKEQIGKNTSEKLRGKPKSEEHKKKISEARRKYWEQKKRLV